MAEDGISNSNFSNKRAITTLLLRNPGKTICASNILKYQNLASRLLFFVTQVLVMAEDGINNSNFTNIRAITPLLLRNPGKTICAS